jgi:isopentenyl phosphate kinase
VRDRTTQATAARDVADKQNSSRQVGDERPIFLKLGGSLITDKRQSEAVRTDVLARLAAEIAESRRGNPSVPLVIGHGSGSFGHLHARRYGTRAGVQSAAEWLGFALTGDAAARLNRAVLTALLQAGVPAWSIQPGAIIRAADGTIARGMVDNVTGALARGLVPVLFGDVVLDDQRGGTIASTEEIFAWLLPLLQPQRVILAGEVDGIYSADPLVEPTAKRIPLLTPATLAAIHHGLGGSHGVDVTGGMIAKVEQALAMVEAVPQLDVIICSGLLAGQIAAALHGGESCIGTRITRDSA